MERQCVPSPQHSGLSSIDFGPKPAALVLMIKNVVKELSEVRRKVSSQLSQMCLMLIAPCCIEHHVLVQLDQVPRDPGPCHPAHVQGLPGRLLWDECGELRDALRRMWSFLVEERGDPGTVQQDD